MDDIIVFSSSLQERIVDLLIISVLQKLRQSNIKPLVANMQYNDAITNVEVVFYNFALLRKTVKRVFHQHVVARKRTTFLTF